MDDPTKVLVGTGLIIIVMLLVTLAAAVVFLFRQQDKARAEIAEDLTSYRSMAREALDCYQDIAERYLQERGLPVPAVLADVVAEHNSPTTRRQSAAANLATQRARLTAINRAVEAACPDLARTVEPPG
jgi:type II secretory pathway pseudopilin PulG